MALNIGLSKNIKKGNRVALFPDEGTICIFNKYGEHSDGSIEVIVTKDTEDVTLQCIEAVFRWMQMNLESDESFEEYAVSFPGSKYVLVLRERTENDVV